MYTNTRNKTAATNDGFWWLLILILIFMIVFSAFFMVYLKDEYRRDFINYENLLTKAADLQLQHNKLLLEQSTWSSDARVQKQATQQLSMLVPQTTEMVVTNGDVVKPNIKYEIDDE